MPGDQGNAGCGEKERAGGGRQSAEDCPPAGGRRAGELGSVSQPPCPGSPRRTGRRNARRRRAPSEVDGAGAPPQGRAFRVRAVRMCGQRALGAARPAPEPLSS